MAPSERFERRVGDIRICVLGPLTVEHDGRELHVAGSHRRRLLAFLASRAGQAATAEAIADALWGEHPPPTVTKSIQNHVARLRGSFAGLDGELVETTAHGYRLAIEPDAVDAAVFERLAAQGRRLLADGDQLGAQSVLEEALALWRGEPYGDVGDSVFARAEAARLSEQRWAGIEDLAQSRLELGEVEVVTADLERLVAEQPGRERSWSLLIRALYSAGRQQDALAAYQRAREVLLDEFGLDPGAELRELEERVLAQDPALAIRRVPALPAALRRGRRAFVGRERERDLLLQAWRSAQRGTGHLRLLFGPVGSGRTRLLAEVASVARGAPAPVVYVRGDEGFGLHRSLTNGATAGAVVDHITDLSRGGPVLVVVDDAEWGDAATISAVSALASAAERAPVLLLVVADSEASGPSVDTVRRLDPDGDHTIDLAQMTDEQLRAIVTAEGLDADAATAVVAVARGLPGLARREAAAWAERAASDRLAAAAASSLDASAAATEARASVFDDVLALVGARARRDELGSSALTGRQPYRALAAYDVQDADLFVGRERLVAELVAHVLDRRFVAVIGASGTGKSSLVRAGLVALVRSGRLPGSRPWRAAVIVPGGDPSAALEAVEGLDDPGPLLLVVDQFEEVFAAGVADVISARLVELSRDRALDVHVVVVVRDDQYTAMAALPALAAVADDPHVLVGPPTDDELVRIVEVPARRTSCAVEPALTAQIAQDVAGHDTALPLVSAALAEVWEVRDGDTLTLAGYRGVGGLAAAVERMGARAIDAAGADAVRNVMLRLVEITDDGHWVRRRVAAADIPSHLEPAVNALVGARLVQRGDVQIDVVHEVVLVAWPQLASWLEDVRADLLLDRDLRNAARAWEAGERNDDYLYRGARLAAAVEFVQRREHVEDAVDADIAAFVETSRETAARLADEQARRQAKVNRRLRSLLTGLAGLLVVALVAGGFALRQADRADDSAARARDEATRADARRVGEAARATTEIGKALLLAVAGVRLDDTPETRANLLAVLGKHPGLIAPRRVPDLPAVGASPDGASVLTYADGRLELTDMNTQAVLAASAAVASVQAWSDVEFRPDGLQVAVLHDSYDPFATGPRSFAPRPVVLYDAKTLARSARQLGGLPQRAAPRDVSFSGDGRWLAVSFMLFHSADDVDPFASPVLVWNLSAPAAPIIRIDTGAASSRVELSRDGRRLYIAEFPPGDVRAYDVATGRQIAAAPGVGSLFSISADRRTLAVTGLNDGRIHVLDAATLAVRTQLSGQSSLSYGFPVFSPDGALVAAPDIDANIVYVWDVATGALVEELVGYTEFVMATWFGAGGRTVHAVTEGGTQLSWDLSNSDRFVQRRPTPPGLGLTDVVFPAADGTIAYVSAMYGSPAPGGAVQLRAPGADTVGAPEQLPHNGVSSFAWNADGSRFATTGADGTVRVWDPRDLSAPLRERKVADGLIEWVAYFPDGRIAVFETSGATYALDGETLADAGAHVDVPYRLFSGETAWDDTVIATTNEVSDLLIRVDLAAGRVVETLHVGFLPFLAATSPDRSRIAITSTKGEMRIYARDGGWLAPGESAHSSSITSVSWSADGSLVATGAAEGAVAVWDGETGALLGALNPGAAGVPVAAYFTTDTDQVSVAAADGPIHTFSTDIDEWIDFACEVAGRNLTRAEWRETFDDRPYRRTCG